MIGLSSSGREAIAAKVEEIFDRIALQFIGDIPRLKYKKLLIINTKPNYGLANLFVEAMANKSPNIIEQDALKSLLETSYGYVDSLKAKTRSNITERVDGIVKEAKLRGDKVTADEIREVLDEEMERAKSHMKAIAESESTKVRNVGSAMDISRIAASMGDTDPTVFFVVVKDGATCNECKRLHLNPDGMPRVWKFSELKQGYHKRGEDSPSAFGLHPHCFTEDTVLHTARGMVSFGELFESQEKLEIYVDSRVKNRKIGNNQYGKEIPGEVWLDRHASGASLKSASPVFDTGKQECLKITLSNGLELKVSVGHEMWVDDGKCGKKVSAQNLLVGDNIPLISGECGYGTDHFPELAELMGNLLGDGSIGDTASWNFFGADLPYYGNKLLSIAKSFKTNMSNYQETLTIYPPNEKYAVESASFNSVVLGRIFKDQFGLSKKPIRVPKRLFQADKETTTAFLRGLYAADGHSEVSPSVVLSQKDKVFLQEVQLLLANIGIRSSIFDHGQAQEKEITYANGDKHQTNRSACYRLSIGGYDQVAIFAKEIGMGVPSKQDKLLSFLQESEGKAKLGAWRVSSVVKIEPIGIFQTYCTNEPMSNTVTANGIVTGNCRCTLTYLASGFGFNKQGRVAYIDRDHDEHVNQRK